MTTYRPDRDGVEKPVLDVRLFCESCHAQHIDRGEFALLAHHTHTCQSCGLTWRPAVDCTRGVQFLPGFKDDLKGEEPPRVRCIVTATAVCVLNPGHRGGHAWLSSEPEPL